MTWRSSADRSSSFQQPEALSVRGRMPAARLRSVCLLLGIWAWLGSGTAQAQDSAETGDDAALGTDQPAPGVASAGAGAEAGAEASNSDPADDGIKDRDDELPPDKPRGAPQVGIAPGTPQTGTLVGGTTQPAQE